MSFDELQDILIQNLPSKILREKREELANLIPEFREIFDFDQKTIWHQYDVFEHTLHVVDETVPDYRVRLAALFHDVGKPLVMTIDDNGEGHFYGHWEESENVFVKYQDKFDLTEENIYLIRKLIYYHDLTIKDDNLDIFLEEFDDDGMRLLFDIKKSDAMAYSEKFVPERLHQLDIAKEKINNEKKRLGIHLNDESYEDDKILLLAFLCNSTDSFAFKTNHIISGSFLVGLNTLDGVLTYLVPIDYWDYFDVPIVNNLTEIEESTKEEQIQKLKSMIKKKTINGRMENE